MYLWVEHNELPILSLRAKTSFENTAQVLVYRNNVVPLYTAGRHGGGIPANEGWRRGTVQYFSPGSVLHVFTYSISF